MKITATYAILGALSYLIGAIPFGFLVARTRGIDIRTLGSGKIGATNVFRSVGKRYGMLVFTLDVLKGFVPAFFFPVLAASLVDVARPEAVGLYSGCLAIVGHNWPVYLGFKGGKGVATSAGVLLGVAPISVGIGVVAWIIVFAGSRFVSVASMLAAVVIALSAWLMARGDSMLIPVVLTLMAMLTVWRHRANIQRLLNGTENRFKPRKHHE